MGHRLGHFGHLVIWSKSFLVVKIRHYNKYFIFIYSEQMTESKIHFDQNDHDHFDQIW